MHQAPASSWSSLASPLRLGLAAAACVTAGACFVGFMFDDAPGILSLPALLLAASAFLLFRDHLASQILVRAALWSNLILGTLIAVSSSGGEVPLGAVMAVATAIGLLCLGRRGLEGESEGFAPVAFRGSLILALVMALADAQSLVLFGAIEIERDVQTGAPILACAALMGVALLGLYRLRVWGLVLNIVANVLIAGLAFTNSLELPDPIIVALCTTAVVQLALPLPLVVAMLRGRAPAERRGSQTVRIAIVHAISIALAGLALAGWLGGGHLVDF